MKLLFILSTLYATGFVRAETKNCQPFNFNQHSTACTNDAGECITGTCKSRLLFIRCTCPDDHPHVGCGAKCTVA
ncbi:hypothetical protein LZ32DRAFT_102765 [Colletotrichum eremochloae]|nr:hypothetical protein LZ32DRAFT_102765 [Colletotrichum eremochloae]